MKLYMDGFSVLLKCINILTLSLTRVNPSYNNFNSMSKGRNAKRTLLGTIFVRLFQELEWGGGEGPTLPVENVLFP